jgi:PAS domain S-box-containing protein
MLSKLSKRDHLNSSDTEALQTIKRENRATAGKKDTNKKYAEFYNFAPVGYFTLNEKRTIIDCNKKALELIGYQDSEIKGLDFFDLVHEQDKNAFIVLLRSAIKLANAKNIEIRIQNQQNGYFYANVYCIANQDISTLDVYYWITVFDISAYKIHEQELHIANERAEVSEKLKSVFLSNLSHDIRTPVNSIIGFTQLLQKDNLKPEKHKQFLDILNTSANQLLSIVNELVEVSRIEVGQTNYVETSFSLNSLIEELVSFFYPIAYDKKIKFESACFFSDDKSYIHNDESKIKQVFNKLIYNAFKYTLEGRVDFGYTCRKNEQGQQELLFYVKDTGIGIPEDQKKAIFEHDWQMQSINSESNYSLSICKAYVEMLGGKIWLDSVVNQGTVFYFTLPYTPSEPNDSEYSKSSSTNWDGKNFLIAEDEEINFLFLKELLQKTNANIIRAVDGEQVVQYCFNLPNIDLVLMDIKMPKMNGFDATKTIKEKMKSLPIIALTAYAYPEDRQRAKEVGCDGYIQKPIDKNLLYQMIESLL